MSEELCVDLHWHFSLKGQVELNHVCKIPPQHNRAIRNPSPPTLRVSHSGLCGPCVTICYENMRKDDSSDHIIFSPKSLLMRFAWMNSQICIHLCICFLTYHVDAQVSLSLNLCFQPQFPMTLTDDTQTFFSYWWCKIKVNWVCSAFYTCCRAW